jgi:hypothetical protein
MGWSLRWTSLERVRIGLGSEVALQNRRALAAAWGCPVELTHKPRRTAAAGRVRPVALAASTR